ncbi:germination protein M [Pullulanibacillus pueri]|uniref:Spore germination protein GerM n=1 Tax=Pullulanibacillus pueri TaxID=1437324 RepID=A0A8J2ZWQ9_9BACL|nr:GerMN domain-containing protein [Pullulanibacillus pueri]MBM7681991.1 germination protein M [Pullulanibacillus pueri]GGH83682.1 spore germination protein GerM [Pullulanibacillus pueri]
MRIPGKKSILTMCVLFPLVLSGCGYDKASPSNTDQVSDQSSIVKDTDQKDQKDNGKKQDEKTAGVERQLYLVDENGHVTPQTFELPKSQSVAKQALEYLVEDGPVSEILPDGFKAVIPAGTTFSVNLKDGTLTADFSKEFTKYKKDDEQKIMQSITWTLTQFDNIDRVKLSVNGKPLQEMPVAKTPLPEQGLTRADGINVDNSSHMADIRTTDTVVVYYLAQTDNGDTYYVPVTKRYSDSEDKLTATVEALKESPIGDASLSSPFNDDLDLVSKPSVNDKGVATLDFNEDLYSSISKKTVSDEALNCLALTFTNEEGINKVAVQVKGDTTPVTESGKSLAKPVSAPDVNVNKTGV